MSEQPRLIENMSFGDYCDIDAVNASRLLTYHGRSPLEAKYIQDHPQDNTRSLQIGHASHARVLQPEVYQKEYAVYTNAFGDYRKQEARDAKAAWEQANRDKVVIDKEIADEAEAINSALMADRIYRDMFTGEGLSEVTLTWTDEPTKLKCKARLDRVMEFFGSPAIIDLKTARDVSDYGLRDATAKYHYHVRMAWYLDALTLLDSQDYRVLLVWVQKAKQKGEPWVVRTTELMGDDIAEGRATYRELLDLHARCVKENRWPGYANAPEPLGLPRWAYKHVTPKG
jgi:exodeoxyribonuclease VIII